MHLVVLGEGEAGAHVLVNEGSLVRLQVLDKCVIDRLLQRGAFGGSSLLLVFVEYVSALGLGGLVLECSVSDLGDVGSLSLHLRARRDRVDLVDALEGHAVDAEGTADEKQTGLELLEEDDTAASIASRSQDEHTALLDTLAQLGSLRLLSTGLTFLVLCWVPIELFDH